ncbi:MAG TPA: ATP-binding protein [Thermoleophilaceae bacterium]|nr:ATP-binding protein [Thermoleophilaceae bacterium]
MSAGEEITPQQFAEAFQRVTEWAVYEGRHGRSPFKERLTEHFGADPSTYPLMSESVAPYDLPNLQLALDAYLGADWREHSLIGFGGPVDHMEISLAGLVHDFGFGLAEGPVRRTVVPLEQGRTVTCVTIGLFLISDGEDRLAALVIQGRHGFENAGLRLEVIAPQQAAGERFVADIRALMHTHNVFRGKVLTLKAGDEMMGRGMAVEFPAVEAVGRDQIVLPEGVLDVVELHTIEFSRHAEALRDAGRHLRRGLLLHGPPGTGKTLSTSYLISRLEGRTVVILTGAALVLVSDACTIARELQPAMVVLEDVDLVAQERTAMGFGATSLLFRLLNEMDGIGEDADVIFVMTTNRADLLEPALAARPGRVDQAVAFPLPDADARSGLLDLFGRGLDVHLADRAAIVAETEGVSPAFLRELVRKAALHAARAGSPRVEDPHFREALDLLERGGRITRAMLGADGGAVERLEAEDAWAEAEWDEE